jgi:hypothetical protein
VVLATCFSKGSLAVKWTSPSRPDALPSPVLVAQVAIEVAEFLAWMLPFELVNGACVGRYGVLGARCGTPEVFWGWKTALRIFLPRWAWAWAGGVLDGSGEAGALARFWGCSCDRTKPPKTSARLMVPTRTASR